MSEQFEAASRAITEVAKAGGQVAETLGKGIDAGRELGEFLSGSSLKQIPRALISLLGGDWIIGKQVENIIQIQAKVHQLAREKGLKLDPQTLPWRIKVDAIRGMADEDDASLQEVWADLLVQAMRSDDRRKELDRIMIDVVRRMSPLSAQLLRMTHRQKSHGESLKRGKLVHLFSVERRIDIGESAIVMDHLTQLRCVQHLPAKGGDHSTAITALGRKILSSIER